MSALTFTLKAAPSQRIDCSPLTPELLAEKNARSNKSDRVGFR